MFYETGTDHGLPYDPFKVSKLHLCLLYSCNRFPFPIEHGEMHVLFNVSESSREID